MFTSPGSRSGRKKAASGGGTTNKVPKWLTPNTLGDSHITDDGSLVDITTGGGDITLTGFTPTIGAGKAISITGGDGVGLGGGGGPINITAGLGSTSGGAGGGITISAGDNSSAISGNGGFIKLFSGDTVAAGATGGLIQILAGTSDVGSGGGVEAQAGSVLDDGSGGRVSFSSGAGGQITGGNGGPIEFNGGSGGVNGNGGDIVFTPGALNGAGANGVIQFVDPSSTFKAIFDTSVLTADRTFAFPDASGTFALISGQTYTPTNVTTTRTFDANAVTIDTLADVLGTLIADMQAKGYFS